VIKNGKDTLLSQNTGTLPNVASALINWFQALTIGIITKTVTDFVVNEVENEVTFQGVWQPMGPRQVQMKPEGQRQWAWFTLHCETSLILKNDDIVKYQSKNYRVMAVNQYDIYGYNEYHLVDDYKDA